ncbi:phosphoglycerate kinase signature [Lucifera butyrica]|uniref:Phosphoglycerate kinase n=1 Tax=Lucifera butyrica TaxID=1351585 RepID=A0A498QZU5_9FIRM|nr:phosphoglycerate kinase [Lucifera butyrica]VBB05756.1 phosphoglycerate kinase signature [Lucifera butyrica]
MAEKIEFGIRGMDEFDYREKTVLLRLDINSPIQRETKKIVSENRIKMSIPTVQYLLERKAKIAILAHQGDTLDYENLIPLAEHAEKLSGKLGIPIQYIDDVAGPAAQAAVKSLKPGEVVLLGNLRYLTEEISTFENAVKLEPAAMLDTYLIRNLAPLADYYVNDAFSAAHRNAPSLVAFPELLPTAGGLLMMQELSALTKVMECPDKPSVFVLGGAKISDAFGMMKQVLENGTADMILTAGVTGNVMLMAKGYSIGKANEKFIMERSLDVFIEPAKEYLAKYPDKIRIPLDLAYQKEGQRREISIEELPIEEPLLDIGSKTIRAFAGTLGKAGTIFVNGPAGVYENKIFENGTKEIWQAIAAAKGYSVIGGGDTVSAAQKYIDLKEISYVCTAGGAMVQFLSGRELPLIKAMRKAYHQ